MARMIDKLPPPKEQGRPPMYPWDQWFNGSPWAILWGEDYRCTHRSMRARVYSAARERTGGTVQIRNLWEDVSRSAWPSNSFGSRKA